MNRDKLSAVWAGLALIGLGIAFILAQWIGWEKAWPLFILVGGLAFLVGWAVTGFKDGGLVFVGTAACLVGLFFFGFTLGYWEWEEMEHLWPVFPLIGGIAFLALFLASRARDVGALGLGCAAAIVGIAGLGVTFGFLGMEIVKFWPLLLVMLGLISLFGVLVQVVRRK